MTKFLQGKWVADEVGEYVFTRTPEGLEMVAQMRGWSYLTKHLTPDEAIEVQKANARLIAAAPSMYTLLSKLLYCGDIDECAVNEIEQLFTEINYGGRA